MSEQQLPLISSYATADRQFVGRSLHSNQAPRRRGQRIASSLDMSWRAQLRFIYLYLNRAMRELYRAAHDGGAGVLPHGCRSQQNVI
jgi:hypothetical protein